MSATEAGNALFVAEVEKMSRKELVKCAEEKFGLNISESISKEEIAKALIKAQEEVVAKSREANLKSAKQVVNESDPLVKIRFINLESPKADAEFFYDSGRGLKAGQKCPRYHFYDQQEYEVPYSVYEHINTRNVPDSHYDVNPETGAIRGILSGTRKRFTCELILDKKQILSLSK